MTSDPGSTRPSAAPDMRRKTLYGRRRGRALRPAQRRAIETVLPRLRIDLPETDTPLDPLALFSDRATDVWLEVGFGSGEHLVAQAGANPRVGFIGCEPYVNGVASLLLSMARRELSNIRVFDDDARLLLARLPTDSIGRVFVLFPDPWPKARHHKRRFISVQTLDQIARVMKDDAELRFATDDPGYLEWTFEHFARHGSFAPLADELAAPLDRPADWPETRYEAKAKRAGRRCRRVRYRRLARGGSPAAEARSAGPK